MKYRIKLSIRWSLSFVIFSVLFQLPNTSYWIYSYFQINLRNTRPNAMWQVKLFAVVCIYYKLARGTKCKKQCLLIKKLLLLQLRAYGNQNNCMACCRLASVNQSHQETNVLRYFLSINCLYLGHPVPPWELPARGWSPVETFLLVFPVLALPFNILNPLSASSFSPVFIHSLDPPHWRSPPHTFPFKPAFIHSLYHIHPHHLYIMWTQ